MVPNIYEYTRAPKFGNTKFLLLKLLFIGPIGRPIKVKNELKRYFTTKIEDKILFTGLN